MYTHDDVEKWALGLPFEDIKVVDTQRVHPYTTLLGKTHFASEAGIFGRITRKDTKDETRKVVIA